MIYTVTLNPSVDLVTTVDHFEIGRHQTARSDAVYPGGRAIYISRILNILDIPTTATGFVGGHTGDFIEEKLSAEGVNHEFIPIQEQTRIDVSIFDGDIETYVMGRENTVSTSEINQLMFYLSRVREGDFMVLAGSLPQGTTADLYLRMIEIAVVNQANFLPILDQEIVLESLPKKPLLITPTVEELSEMLEEDLRSKEDLLRAGLECIDMGAKNIIINRGLEGSLLVTGEKKMYEASGPTKKIASETYTNQALVAGFIGDYMRINDAREAFLSAQAVCNATYYSRSLPSLSAIHQELEAMEVLPLN